MSLFFGVQYRARHDSDVAVGKVALNVRGELNAGTGNVGASRARTLKGDTPPHPRFVVSTSVSPAGVEGVQRAEWCGMGEA